MKASDTHLPYFTSPSIFMGKIWSPPFFRKFRNSILPPPRYKGDNFGWDDLGCLGFDTFDFQLKFNLQYTNFVLKENLFFLMIYTV